MLNRSAPAFFLGGVLLAASACAPSTDPPIARFGFDGTTASAETSRFDGTTANAETSGVDGLEAGTVSFVSGLAGEALRFEPQDPPASLTLAFDSVPFRADRDFSVEFWMRTEAAPDQRFVVLSQKDFGDNSLASQKNPGWVFFMSGGTWAWSLGSGSRRITYERDNGQHMPLNDGRWHQLAMTYSAERAEVRLFYDGVNWVTYHVSDANGFDFTNPSPVVAGWGRGADAPQNGILPGIEAGAAALQALVDAFDALGLSKVEPDELLELIAEPRELFQTKVAEAAARRADGPAFRAAMERLDWEPVSLAESALMSSPYTIHQNQNFTGIALVARLYALIDGEIVVRTEAAREVAEAEKLSPPDFEMDELRIWDREISPSELSAAYTEHHAPNERALQEQMSTLTAAVWNIWHGGKHWTVPLDGWDSRVAIAEMIEEEGADVVMMQETYSSGDFIAAELGYYFATTVDWDYLNQGANISVLSRYPITEVRVPEGSPFQNVGTRVTISRTQDLYVMSNWYGMDRFSDVFDFHQARFAESDVVPTLFGGDFNAVPHTDGGDSPASLVLLGAGFTDAYRSLHPDVEGDPGPTHRNGQRIDQLYYKGVGLTNTSTAVISARPGGFPSDHSLIVARFDLDYRTPGR